MSPQSLAHFLTCMEAWVFWDAAGPREAGCQSSRSGRRNGPLETNITLRTRHPDSRLLNSLRIWAAKPLDSHILPQKETHSSLSACFSTSGHTNLSSEYPMISNFYFRKRRGVGTGLDCRFSVHQRGKPGQGAHYWRRPGSGRGSTPITDGAPCGPPVRARVDEVPPLAENPLYAVYL